MNRDIFKKALGEVILQDLLNSVSSRPSRSDLEKVASEAEERGLKVSAVCRGCGTFIKGGLRQLFEHMDECASPPAEHPCGGLS